MLAAINPTQLHSNSICFSPRTDNNVVRGTYFYRCLYSQESIMTSGVFIAIPLRNTTVNTTGKGFISFNIGENAEAVQAICNIEKTLLNRLDLRSTVRVESLGVAARSGVIRNIVYSGQHQLGPSAIIVIRVSGVWEDDIGHGLVYRFIVPSHPL